MAARKTHQAAAWAIRSATAASFLSRTSLLWLNQMQARISPEVIHLQQDLSKLIAATEYMANTTINAAKFATRALASNVASRCLLWLCQWQADTRSRCRLAAAPFKGCQLFGEVLDPILVEGKDKRKFLPQLNRRYDRRPTPYYLRQSFWNTEVGFPASQSHRAYFHGSDRSQDRSGFRDRSRQTQSRWPYRGLEGRPYHRSKLLLDSNPYWRQVKLPTYGGIPLWMHGSYKL